LGGEFALLTSIDMRQGILILLLHFDCGEVRSTESHIYLFRICRYIRRVFYEEKLLCKSPLSQQKHHLPFDPPMTEQIPIPAPLVEENLPPDISSPTTDLPPPPAPAPVPPPFAESTTTSDVESLSKNMTPDEEKIYAIRFKVIEELLATEWLYVNDLKTLVTVFYYPLKRAEQEGKEILPAEEISTIFSNVEAILAFNEQLYKALRSALGRGTAAGASCVGDVFFRLADYLKMYTTYCQNHKNAVEAMQRCMKKYHKFAQFLEKQLPETNGLLLKDYLIKPVQRLCKYPLLFTELLKSTPKTHPDYIVIEATIEKVRHVADSVNKSTALQENITKLFELKELLVGFPESLEAADRWYIKEAPILASSTNDKNYPELSERHVILFSDMIMLCKNKKKKLYFKESLKLEGATLRDLKDDQKRKNAFEIVSGKNPGQIFTLSFATLKDKTSWYQSINGAIVGQQPFGTKGGDSLLAPTPISSSPSATHTPPATPVDPAKRLSQKEFETATKKRTHSTSSSSDYKDALNQLKVPLSHRVNVTKGTTANAGSNESEEECVGTSEQDDEESDEVKRKAKALNKEEGKAVNKQKLGRTHSNKSIPRSNILKRDNLSSSAILSPGVPQTPSTTTTTTNSPSPPPPVQTPTSTLPFTQPTTTTTTTTTTTSSTTASASVSVAAAMPTSVSPSHLVSSPSIQPSQVTQIPSTPKTLSSPSVSLQNLSNPKISLPSTSNVPLNVPVDLTEVIEDDTSALKLRVKELTRRLRKEKRARSDLETKYTALVDAFRTMEASYLKMKELITAFEEERQSHKTKSSQGTATPPPPQPQKIDNTTTNREFVSPEDAKKDVEDWLKIFGKK
jgi:hypothetical protein